MSISKTKKFLDGVIVVLSGKKEPKMRHLYGSKSHLLCALNKDIDNGINSIAKIIDINTLRILFYL
mgnify:CR=1 FL=1